MSAGGPHEVWCIRHWIPGQARDDKLLARDDKLLALSNNLPARDNNSCWKAVMTAMGASASFSSDSVPVRTACCALRR